MSIDTVNDLEPRVQYVAVAAQTQFDYPFPIFQDADLVVDVDGIVQALTTDYTVAGEGDDTGGTITFLTAMSGGEIVTIYRDIAIERTTDFQQHGPFASASFNDDLDRLTLVQQQLESRLNRCLRVPMASEVDSADMELTPLSSWANKYLAFDADGAPTPAVAIATTTLTQAIIGALLDPQTAAEADTSVTPNPIYPSLPYDVRRAGLVPNSSAARAANTAALKTLLDPDTPGPKGWIVFPNTTGADTYYFGVDDIPIRDGVCLDLQGCTLDFSGSYAAAMDLHGFLECIRDVTIENGKINVDYDGSAGTNNGCGIRIGSRPGYPFGAATDGLQDEDLAAPQGRVVLRNLGITFTNPDTAAAILMLGGLENVLLENISIDGDAVALKGIYYEFGFWDYTAGAGAVNESSHATNLQFRNISIKNLATGATGTPVAFGLVGVMSATVDGLVIDGGYTGVSVRCGEALYYNMGPPNLDQRAHITMRNVTITDTVSTAFSFLGAESKSSGYLSAEAGVTEAKQCDLISLTLDGFSIEGTTVFAGRSVALRNGVQRAGSTSGGILLQDELMWFDISNVRVLDNAGIGIRSQTGTNIFSVARFKNGSIRNCLVAGNGTNANEAGIALGNSKGVIIDACRFGYELVHDGVAESTQGPGVSNTSTAHNTTIRNCYGGGITSTGSPAMYTNAASGGWKYAKLENVAGVATLSGQWTRDGYGMDADNGNADDTLDPGVDLPDQLWATPLTAPRAAGLGTGYQGAKFRVTRAASATGGDPLNVGTGPLKALAAGQWCTVLHDGSAWRLTEFGSL